VVRQHADRRQILIAVAVEVPDLDVMATEKRQRSAALGKR
jgi:hypothetical protein